MHPYIYYAMLALKVVKARTLNVIYLNSFMIPIQSAYLANSG